MHYSRIQLIAFGVSLLGGAFMLLMTKLFHDMDAGWLPYISLLGFFVCFSFAKGVLLDGSWEDDNGAQG